MESRWDRPPLRREPVLKANNGPLPLSVKLDRHRVVFPNQGVEPSSACVIARLIVCIGLMGGGQRQGTPTDAASSPSPFYFG